jgi:AP endonuclease 1
MKRKASTIASAESPSRPRRTKTEVNYTDPSDDPEVNGHDDLVKETPKKRSKSTPTATPRSTTKKAQETKTTTTNGHKASTSPSPQPAKKRKSAAKSKAGAENAEPLAPRTTETPLRIGPHVSAAGGIPNAVTNAVHVGANAFGLFLKSQRKWANPPLEPDVATTFKSSCETHHYGSEAIVPHGSYLVNLAHTDSARAEQAYDGFIDDLGRCAASGIVLYNIHPGNVASSTRDEGIAQLAKQLNRAFADPRSGNVVVLLETMATAGNTLGGTFEDLAAIIAQVDDKTRVGVCLDTCHVFAAGYDLRSPDAWRETMAHLDATVGLRYLRAFHVNDSKAPLASHRDLHANIGTGFLGLRAFWNLVNDERVWGLPCVLETPLDDYPAPPPVDGPPPAPAPEAEGKKKAKKLEEDRGVWAREIKLLESLKGMDVKSEEFLKLERDLHVQGTKEREKIQAQVDKKAEKDSKKGAGKGKKQALLTGGTE